MASAMQSATFVLLPDYTYPPNKDIHLGTILLQSEETKLPDPDLPLNEKSRVPPLDAQIKRSKEKPWAFVYGEQRGGSGSLSAEIPIFSLVGGGFGYSRAKSKDLKIECDWLETQRFVPNGEYLSQALKDDFVQEYCRQKWFPSVYMVTGLKIAYNAVIKNASASERSGHGNVNVDTTVTGVPLKIGRSLDRSRDDRRGTTSTVVGPFILAYQLKRLKLKGDATVKKMEGYNKHALMDDRQPVADDTAEENLEEFWEMEDVLLPETEHGE